MTVLQLTAIAAFLLAFWLFTEDVDDDDEGGGTMQPVYVRR